MRGLGVESALAALPGVVVVIFALVTQLGDVWFLSLVVGLLYWLGPHTPRIGDATDRRRSARLVGLLLLSFVVVSVAKPLFALPRPPGAGIPPHADLVPAALMGVYEWLSTGSGYGFPSGHAFGSTMIYGGLAWAVRVGSWRRRAALAASMVVLLSLSRLVLGLHYLVDVLAGAALGLLGLGLAVRLLDSRQVFGLAAAVGVAGVAAIAQSPDPVAAAGAAVGATVAWLVVGDSLPEHPSRASAYATVAVGTVTTALLLAVAIPVHTVLPAVALLGLIGGGLVVAMPLVGERVAKKRLVED